MAPIGVFFYRLLKFQEIDLLGMPKSRSDFDPLDVELKICVHRLKLALGIEKNDWPLFLENIRGWGYRWKPKVKVVSFESSAKSKKPEIFQPLQKKPRSEKSPKPLAELQKNLIKYFEDLNIQTAKDLSKSGKDVQERLLSEFVKGVAGLGNDPNSLLEVDHLNIRFIEEDLAAKPELHQALDVLHRKCAIYADHTVVELPAIGLNPEGTKDLEYRPEIIQRFLTHRSLIKTGKMTLVPKQVTKHIEDDAIENFSIEKLQTVEVDLDDPMMRRTFLQKGSRVQSAGVLILDTPAGGRLHLDDIMEIETRYCQEYTAFQSHLRMAMESFHTEDETTKMKRALKTVESGICGLDRRYKEIKGNVRMNQVIPQGTGSIALQFYGSNADAEAFLKSAFSVLGNTANIRFIPASQPFPAEIRNSPFFVPWLMDRKMRNDPMSEASNL